MQIRSSDSVKIISLDIGGIIGKLKRSADRAMNMNDDISEIFLFGSLATAEAVPGSDADIMIILKKSDKRILDRVVDFMDFFKDIGVGIDIFPYTIEELNKFEEGWNPFIEEMFAHRIKLA
ncbi:MAG: hypothetical protein C5S47_07515 [Candidatus Methanogasteraceae archaeon]|nr:MAG: hypothetical protein C5S47_07515 [ANME-2 cluster archaeon]